MRITYVGAGVPGARGDHPDARSQRPAERRLRRSPAFYGGTGLLIAVSVAFDLVQKIDSHLVMRNYRGLDCAKSLTAAISSAGEPEHCDADTRPTRTRDRVRRTHRAAEPSSQRADTSIAARNRPDARGRPGRLARRTRSPPRWSRPGVTTGEIDAAVETFFAEHGAIPLFKGVPGQGAASRPSPASRSTRRSCTASPAPRCCTRATSSASTPAASSNGWCGDSAVTHAGRARSRPRSSGCSTSPRARCDLAIELMGSKQPLERGGRARWSSYVQRRRLLRSSRSSSATASAARCTKTRRCPTSSARSSAATATFACEPGLVIAVEPMVNMGTKHVKSLPDHWTQVDAGRPAQRPLRAHGRHDRRRPVRADRRARMASVRRRGYCEAPDREPSSRELNGGFAGHIRLARNSPQRP